MSEKCIFIEPCKFLKGTVEINPSKSYCHRYLITGALCILSHKSDKVSMKISTICEDVRATLNCLEELGIHSDIDGSVIVLSRKDIPEGYSPVLDCAESGTTLRFILPVVSLFFDSFTVTGSGSLLSRPIKPYLDSLEANGIEFETDSNFCLPLKGKGKLRAGEFVIPGNISSQFISGLLMTLPFVEGKSSLCLISKAQSVPYIKMTLKVLEDFGIVWNGSVDKGYFEKTDDYNISAPSDVIVPEGDWSSASFWICSNYLGSDIQVKGLNEESIQGDRAISDMLKMIAKYHPIDVSNTPDTFPVLAVCAALKPVKTVFTGIGRLKYKESNRINSVIALIKNIGGTLRYDGDSMTVYGKNILTGGTVNSFGDHRIAMAACVAAPLTRDGIKLIDYDVAGKSYPSFYEDFTKLGGKFNVCDLG